MAYFLRFCSIVSIIIASFRLAMIGNLTPGTVIFIIICGLLILIGNRKIFIVAAAVAALVLFVKNYGGSSIGQLSLLQNLLMLSMVVFGLYIMLKGILSGRRNAYHSKRT